MRQLSRHRTTIVSAFLAGLLLAPAVLPALAKEELLATFDAPIAMGTPGGTEILVGMMVTVPDGDVAHPVEGSPIYLRIFGPDKAFTEASGRIDATPGHYAMRIAIPEGGARRVEVVIRGTTDLPIMLANDPLTFGGIKARTAQLAPAPAPALAPPITPFPRASVAVTAAGPSLVAAPVTPASGSSPLPDMLAGIVALAVVGGVVLAMRRRSRPLARRSAPERAPGA